MKTNDPALPYNALPKLPPSIDVETIEILRECIAAHRALAELKGAAKSVPSQQLLIDTLTIQEAKASSEIENVVTTSDQLYIQLAIGDEAAEPTAKEVGRYRPALYRGEQRLRERPILSVDLFTRICAEVVGYDTEVRNHEVRLENPATREVMYTPPLGKNLILELLSNLQDFVYSFENYPDPLIRMAILHYQFEAVHPFPDGNGRTGRILNILYLVDQGLLDRPILYLSRYFLRNRSDYYSKLRAVTQKNNWIDWIQFVIRGVTETAIEARNTVDQIRDLRQEYAERTLRDCPTAASEQLLNLVFERPYSTVGMVQDAEQVSRNTASAHLDALEKAGMLTSRRIGRYRVFLNNALIELLGD